MKAGFPPNNPKRDLNGFRLNLPEGEPGWSFVNSHCSQKATCDAAPNVRELKASNPPCSSFREIFDELRVCEEKGAAKIKGYGNCKDLILDAGYWRNV